jgi:hypothetical protein
MQDIHGQCSQTRRACHLTCISCSSTSLPEHQLIFLYSPVSWLLRTRFIMSNSSPLPSASSSMGRRDAPSSTTGTLAFLVHSQETVANKMPPEVDNKALARQRRRRTRY